MKLHDTVNIAGCYLPALINGDDSGLDDLERKLLASWEHVLVKECNSSITFNIIDNEPYFTRDCITGLMADCYTVELWIIGR